MGMNERKKEEEDKLCIVICISTELNIFIDSDVCSWFCENRTHLT